MIGYDLEQRALIDLELTKRSIDFMRRQVQANRPFFLFVPYTQTHYPALPHPDFAGRTGNGRWADVLAQVDAPGARQQAGAEFESCEPWKRNRRHCRSSGPS